MRHGKAADGFEYNDDFDRPLVQKGKDEVKIAANRLMEAGFTPDTIIASPAFRTAGTARIVADVFNIPAEEIQFEASLYNSRLSAYFHAINNSDKETIMLVGHNPFVGEIAQMCSKYALMHFPTSAVAAFEIPKGSLELNFDATLLWSDLRK